MDAPSGIGRLEDGSSDTAILLIDDNPAIARAIDIALRIAGYRLDTASGPEEAWSRLARRHYVAILLDMNFTAGAADGEDGLACLRRIVADDPQACVIVITAHSGIRIAVAAMQAGARDFVMKPWRNADLVAKLEAAMARRPAIASAPARDGSAKALAVLIGESRAMQELRALIRRIGPTAADVTVTGPAGSGRTLVAQAIHAASPDATRPASRIDLRRDDYLDRVQEATGTIILRHADRLDRIAQEALLDHLPRAVRCIAVADTIQPLAPALQRRIATVEVAVPPLAARGDDTVLLARHFARVAAERFGKPGVTLTQAAETIVRTVQWGDEVRGLALAMERAVILADDGVLDAALLAPPTVVEPAIAAGEASFDLTDAEKAMIEAALREHRHNVTHAATALGLSRGALYRRMARYGL
ncbi:response regulator [Sphingomonas sp. CROZ-RG-20F-R02-07]|uniref:sigma-54-dependent transcriptional regulator n=1 Tax=Sphingomonas sp. CROZ-RG-20F-R02-07 TaxID=2914832 RepID=UPI001F5896CC